MECVRWEAHGPCSKVGGLAANARERLRWGQFGTTSPGHGEWVNYGLIPMPSQRSDMPEPNAGGSPERSRAVPFAAEEIRQRRELIERSTLLV
jgi:hypothetical protein